jgi:hypothetical protein
MALVTAEVDLDTLLRALVALGADDAGRVRCRGLPPDARLVGYRFDGRRLTLEVETDAAPAGDGWADVRLAVAPADARAGLPRGEGDLVLLRWEDGTYRLARLCPDHEESRPGVPVVSGWHYQDGRCWRTNWPAHRLRRLEVPLIDLGELADVEAEEEARQAQAAGA